MIALEERLLKLIERQEDMLGNADGRSCTATLHVSPDGTGEDGLSWRTAYITLNAALDAASTDVNDLTLILIAPHTTYYDINTTGNPSWAANVILRGSYRYFVEIRNTHADATSIMILTGKSAVEHLTFDLHTGSSNGLIMTAAGAEVTNCHFHGVNLTGAATALHMDGATVMGCKVIDCDIHGHITHLTGLLIDGYTQSNFERLRIHDCLIGMQIVNATSDHNIFDRLDIGECALGLDIDAGNEQLFSLSIFHHNTRNIDDEVGDHIWLNIFGAFDVAILPDDLVGTAVNTGAAGVYGADTQILAAAGRDNPFRIVGISFDPSSAAEWYSVRFSHDTGTTFYDVLMFVGVKREGIAAPSGTEHIFNRGTRISCSARDVTGGDSVQVWVEIQEI